MECDAVPFGKYYSTFRKKSLPASSEHKEAAGSSKISVTGSCPQITSHLRRQSTGYGLDGPGIESRWGRVFSHLSRPALEPTHPPVQLVPGLSRG